MPNRKTARSSGGAKSGSRRREALPKKIKRILDGDKRLAKIVMFESEKHNDFFDVAISVAANLAVQISVVEHPLDQYSSPHLLDLSAKKYIERTQPVTSENHSLVYADLPGAEILEKLHLFEFLNISNSEILQGLQKIWRIALVTVRRPFQRIDLSPKLALSGKAHKQIKSSGLDAWQEVSIINLVSFIWSGVDSILSVLWQVTEYIYTNSIGQYIGRDEVVTFKSKEIATEDGSLLQSDRINNIAEVHESDDEKVWFKFGGIFSNFNFNIKAMKPLLAFFIVAFIVTIPVRSYFYLQETKETKGMVLGQTEEALDSLRMAQKALSSFDLVNASDYLSAANSDFVSASEQLNEIKSFLTVLADTLPMSNTYRSGKNLLELGERLTKAGEYLISGMKQLTGESDFSLASRAKNFKADLNEALSQLEGAQENLDKINIGHLPEENQAQFIALIDNLPIFVNSLRKSDEIIDFAVNFLGDNDFKRYLIVFQNDNELRATGGFMGSFALVDFKNGDISEIKMPGGGTYDVRAGLTELLQSPEPMRLINPRWEFQDSNWWPDFPMSANNIAYFYNKSDGATIDGVIAINSDWLGSLLNILGPVEMPEYKKVITAANFEMELQRSVEIEYDDKKTPKKILGDLAPELIKRIFDVEPGQIMGLVASLKKGLSEKDIQIHLFDEDEQRLVVKNNWDGRMKDTSSDYLSVVATNIGGGKTDGVINQELYHKATILEDGSVIDTLLISRSHFGPIDTDFTNVPNRSYLRIYVPLGSELIKAEGFARPDKSEFKIPEDYLKEDKRLFNERMALIDDPSLTRIYVENNKTVFGNWVTISPGESQDILLVYKLPFSLDFSEQIESGGWWDRIKSIFISDGLYDSYSLLVQKQSGSNDDKFVSKVIYPSNISSQITYPQEVTGAFGENVYSSKLVSDLFYFVGLQK